MLSPRSRSFSSPVGFHSGLNVRAMDSTFSVCFVKNQPANWCTGASTGFGTSAPYSSSSSKVKWDHMFSRPAMMERLDFERNRNSNVERDRPLKIKKHKQTIRPTRIIILWRVQKPKHRKMIIFYRRHGKKTLVARETKTLTILLCFLNWL